MASYKKLIYYPGKHTPMPNKSETYRVEGVNAELRHYLARLHRRSRCFSRCAEALRRNVKLFVYAWNRRQLRPHSALGYQTPAETEAQWQQQNSLKVSEILCPIK